MPNAGCHAGMQVQGLPCRLSFCTDNCDSMAAAALKEWGYQLWSSADGEHKLSSGLSPLSRGPSPENGSHS